MNEVENLKLEIENLRRLKTCEVEWNCVRCKTRFSKHPDNVQYIENILVVCDECSEYYYRGIRPY